MRSESLASRRRVVEVDPRANTRAYIADHDDDDDGETVPVSHRRTGKLEEIGAAIGCTWQRAQQIEAVALEKFKIGIELYVRLGDVASEPVLARLRGQPISVYRGTLMDLKEKRDHD
jgi:hypothetical protein